MRKAILTRRYRAAIRAATCSIADLAREAGYSKPWVEAGLYHRAPSKAVALAIADALEARAERLVERAWKLREAAGEQPGGAGRASRRRRVRR